MPDPVGHGRPAKRLHRGRLAAKRARADALMIGGPSMAVIVRSEERPDGHAYYRMPEESDPRRTCSARLRFRYLIPAGSSGSSDHWGVRAQKYRLNDAAIVEDGGALIAHSEAGINSFPGVFGFLESEELLAIIGAT